MPSPMTPSTTPAVNTLFAGQPTFAEMYEKLLVGPLFRPWAERLLDSVSLAAGARVLDVACGTGIVARLAGGRLGQGAAVVGVDKSAVMLAVARRVAPSIDWREGDATALPLGKDEHFDVVLCHEGLQFFPDRRAGVREMRRALAPHGRLGIAVWRSLEDNGVFAELGRVAERFVGPIQDIRHSFSDADALRQLLVDAHFQDVKVDRVSLEVRFAMEPAMLARLNANAVIGMSGARSAEEPERQTMINAIVEASVPVLRLAMDGNEIVSPTSGNIATARADDH